LLRRFAPDFPIQRFPTVEAQAFAAVSAFDASILAQRSGGLGVGAQQRPLEAQYLDEFYRACTTVLGRAYLRSEWSDRSMGSPGRVDFYVPDVGWAIELMRDGEHAAEHIGRFLPGGRYDGALTARRMTACILLDFRQSIPRAARREFFCFMFSQLLHCMFRLLCGVLLSPGPFVSGHSWQPKKK
jgi:hypothetical protein